jgi:outer membrane protein OmpA-like peptidoglycan-associated protein
MKRLAAILTTAIAATLAACATTPESMPEVDQAKARVETLATNPLTQQAANRELTAARGALAQAEQALADGEDEELIVHLAYLAERRADIGLTRVEEAEARQRIAKAEAQRNEVLLEARSAEARAAQQRAQASQQEAEASRESALQARAELEELRKDLTELQAKPTERGMVLTLGDVLFDTAQATLKPGADQTIDQLAEFLEKNEGTRIRIEGHTDSRGSDEYNRELSRQRAQSVAGALESEGIPPSRVEVLGRGEGYPVAGNESAAGRQQNRRVEIVFSNPTGSFTSAAETVSSTTTSGD